MPAHITLILGGARSGKSTNAERLARRGDRVLFVATAEARDEEMKYRIEAHRRSRPAGWDTLEEPRALVSALRPHLDRYDVFLVDCMTMWVSNLLLEVEKQDHSHVERHVQSETLHLLDLMEETAAAWILVSNEVGLGLVPAFPLGRVYRDLLGRVNQIIAARADRVRLMVAGLPFDVASDEKTPSN